MYNILISTFALVGTLLTLLTLVLDRLKVVLPEEAHEQCRDSVWKSGGNVVSPQRRDPGS